MAAVAAILETIPVVVVATTVVDAAMVVAMVFSAAIIIAVSGLSSYCSSSAEIITIMTAVADATTAVATVS